MTDTMFDHPLDRTVDMLGVPVDLKRQIKINRRLASGPNGALARRQAFVASAFSAEWTTYCGTGRMPEEEAIKFRADRDGVGIVYVVFSYSTPIAWVRKDNVVVQGSARYSVTSSMHQGMARAWLK